MILEKESDIVRDIQGDTVMDGEERQGSNLEEWVSLETDLIIRSLALKDMQIINLLTNNVM